MTKAEKTLNTLLQKHREIERAEVKKLTNTVSNGRYILVKHFYGYCSVLDGFEFASRKDAKTAFDLLYMIDDNCSLEIRDTLSGMKGG